ncbi:MAG: malto-oligosyltrehalose synthase, partial [Actinomycetota bacterium]|nr:malto-oligosyltrehalose synthase [Actinomycetota bacterium]
ADLGVYRADYPALRARLERVASAIAVRMPRLAPALELVVRATASPGAATSRLAQTCGAVTAKSVEDSLFYRTARLVSAQEVGGDPADPTVSVREFHVHNLHRNREWPWAMTATSTHDTKRGEDVRARIAVLAQVPERWSILVDALWRSTPPPDDLTGYFLLQNIVGVWPTDGPVDDTLRTRITEYATKAARESGLRTTWTDVDVEFESAVAEWITAITTGEAAQMISALVTEIIPSWQSETLGRKLIALLGPGVGDIYQGTQWWDDSLVDPDNRRPVDHERSPDHPKTQLIRAALGVRTRHAASFGAGSDYTPLHAEGRGADHVIAFARGAGGRADVVVVATRLTHSLSDAGREATTLALPAGTWRDALVPTAQDQITADQPVALSRLTAFHGVALLTRAD